MISREQLRAQMLANADQASNSLLWRWMTPAQRNLLIAGRQVNSQNTSVVNAYLDLVLAQLSTMQTMAAVSSHASDSWAPFMAGDPPVKPTVAEISAMYDTLYSLIKIVNPDAVMAASPKPALPTAEEVSAMLRTVFLLVEFTSPDSLS